LQDTRAASVGGNRRGGGKPRGRNAEAPWQAFPEGGGGPRGSRPPGVDSGAGRTTEGRSLEEPRRGSPDGRPTGPMVMVGAGQGGTEGQEGRADVCSLIRARPGRRSSKTSRPRESEAGERQEGGGKADVPRRRPGRSPHLVAWRPFQGEAGGADGARDGFRSARSGRLDPEDPVNPIPDRRLVLTDRAGSPSSPRGSSDGTTFGEHAMPRPPARARRRIEAVLRC